MVYHTASNTYTSAVVSQSFTVTNPLPGANFIATPTNGTAPLTVQFTDTSTNSPTSWNWTFGDGGTSTAQNPSYTYTTPGIYTVTLNATNAGGSKITTKTGFITVLLLSPPVANFTATPTSGTAPLTVQFTDESTNSPTSWNWTFGDGGTSTLQNPTHTYTSTWPYNVGLTVANAKGSATTVQTGYVNVTSRQAPGSGDYVPSLNGITAKSASLFNDNYLYPLPGAYFTLANEANFTWVYWTGGSLTAVNQGSNIVQVHSDPYGGTEPGVNSFGSALAGGDGGTGSAYGNGANYVYTFTVTPLTGYPACEQIEDGVTGGVWMFYISPTPPTNYIYPPASFMATPTFGNIPLTVQFNDTTNATTGLIPTSWLWNFGDGGTSTAQNSSHVYTTAGDYTVSLNVTIAGGSTTGTGLLRHFLSPGFSNFTATPTSGTMLP